MTNLTLCVVYCIRSILPGGELSGIFFVLHSLKVDSAAGRQSMCTQSTKDVLERMLHSSDFHGLCPSGNPKTSPLVQEVSSSAPATAEPSLSSGCSRQLARQAVVDPCPLLTPVAFSKNNRRDSLHSINPAFRLASPSPTLSRRALVLGDGPDIGFIPQH